MKWSKYNLLFHSQRHGYLLYNSLTNSFAEIDTAVYPQLQQIRTDPDSYDFSRHPALYLQLRTAKVLVDDGEEEQQLNLLKLQRFYHEYDNSNLMLTIAPTLACNFDCSYCYQEHRRPVFMDDSTEDNIITFIKRFGKPRYLTISWFGGEPLLKFDRVVSLSEKIRALNIPFIAMMITNGYLLNREIIGQLDGLKIRTIQITIDGPRKVHDSRRVLIGGGPTFQQLVNNIGELLEGWTGKLNIRVNVDKENWEHYHEVHAFLRRTFQGKNLIIYPGIVTGDPETNPDLGCLFSKEDEVAFAVQQYREHGIDDLQYYPRLSSSGCIATRRNGFVIGPTGEVYNCWHDMGDPDMIVGRIDDEKSWNMNLLANYTIGSSHFDDPVCQSCFYLPVCDGGCVNMRLRNTYYDGQHDVCVKFAKGLPELLEIYYEKKQKESALSSVPDHQQAVSKAPLSDRDSAPHDHV